VTSPTKQPQSWLSIYTGQVCCGHILNRGKAGWEAFDRDDSSLGIFKSQADAINAIDQQPNADAEQ
jgi:hypothetical protein